MQDTPAVPSVSGHFFSDTHLFHPRNGAADRHLRMLYTSAARKIFAVGDTFDFEELAGALMREGFHPYHLPERFDEVLRRIALPYQEFHLRFVDVLIWKASQGVDVTVITGNHDLGLDLLDGYEFCAVKFCTERIYEAGGQKFLVEHGHMFDPAYFREFSGIYNIGSAFLSGGLGVDHAIGRVLPPLRRAFPVSNLLKRIGKSYVRGFIDRAMEKAKRKKLDGIICGHIHKQDDRTRLMALVPGKVINEGVRYINCGDGLTHGTSVVHEAGEDGCVWRFLKPRDISKDARAILADENPLAEYRPYSMAFLQAAWQAHVEYVRQKAMSAAEAETGAEGVPVGA